MPCFLMSMHFTIMHVLNVQNLNFSLNCRCLSSQRRTFYWRSGTKSRFPVSFAVNEDFGFACPVRPTYGTGLPSAWRPGCAHCFDTATRHARPEGHLGQRLGAPNPVVPGLVPVLGLRSQGEQLVLTVTGIQCAQARGRPLEIFVFASARAVVPHCCQRRREIISSLCSNHRRRAHLAPKFSEILEKGHVVFLKGVHRRSSHFSRTVSR